MKPNRLKISSSNSFSKSSPLWKSLDNNDWRLQQWKGRRRIESIPFQSWYQDQTFLCLSSGHAPGRKTSQGSLLQSERLYVINTGEGKWIEHEVAGVEEEKSGIMRRQPVGSTTLCDYSQQDSYESIQEYTYSCSDLWLLLWFLVKSALMCLLPTQIHIRLCQKCQFSVKLCK